MRLVVLALSVAVGSVAQCDAQELTSKWTTVVAAGSKTRQTISIPDNALYRSLPQLDFKGPGAQHPFLLDTFSVTGEWRLSPEGVVPDPRENAALLLATGDELELEGKMNQYGHGGWFILVGWAEGGGHMISSFTMRQSGSPWFITGIRDRKPVPGVHKEFDSFEWKGEQDFRLSIKDSRATLKVGKDFVFAREELVGYQPGAVILGVYNTRYGQKPVILRSLKARAFESAPDKGAPPEPVAEEFSREEKLPHSFLAIDTKGHWTDKKNLQYVIDLKERGRVRITSLDPVTQKPSKYPTYLEKFNPTPIKLGDETTAWNCYAAFELGTKRPVEKALARLSEDGNTLQFAIRVGIDQETGARINGFPTSLDGDEVAAFTLVREGALE